MYNGCTMIIIGQPFIVPEKTFETSTVGDQILHFTAEKKDRRWLYVLIAIELVLMAMALCAILLISWNHIRENRAESASASIAAFDTAPVSANIGSSLKAARERITEERDDTVWTTDTVNYRIGPDKSYESAGTLNIYTELKRTGTTYNKWSRVIVNEEEYFVISKYLTDEPPLITASGQKGEYQKYALSIIGNYGWADSEIIPLIKLWDRESGWNPNSHNRSSGAHGIPQALPASKMASEGSDYYTNGNTQIRWGLGYIARRYGSPSAAWAHFSSSGWY